MVDVNSQVSGAKILHSAEIFSWLGSSINQVWVDSQESCLSVCLSECLLLAGQSGTGDKAGSWRQGTPFRLWHSPSLVVTGLSVGYEMWTLTGWCYGLYAHTGWLGDSLPVLNGGYPAMHYAFTWLVQISTLFQRPRMTVPLHSPNCRQTSAAVQGDCERVYTGSEATAQFTARAPGHQLPPTAISYQDTADQTKPGIIPYRAQVQIKILDRIKENAILIIQELRTLAFFTSCLIFSSLNSLMLSDVNTCQ